MGTSGAYDGSGGRDWAAARESVDELVADPASAEQQATVISDVASALDWDSEDVPLEGTGDSATGADRSEGGSPNQGPPVQLPFRRLVRPTRGRADGPGSGGGALGSGTGAVPRARGGRRSRQRAALVGGAVLAAGLAVRRDDGATLQSLGLSLDELRELGPLAQCNRILRALVGSGADIDENEMLAASSTALVAVLTGDLGPAAAVRVFIVEYVMEIALTELGAAMRQDGAGEISIEIEDGLRSLVTAQADQLALDDSQLGPQQLQDALYQALGSVRSVLEAMS